MRPEHGLGTPQMCIAGDDSLRVFGGEREQGGHQLRQLIENRFGRSAQIQARIERDLFIAAASV